jgi:sec-independent protein translocase protein TatB
MAPGWYPSLEISQVFDLSITKLLVLGILALVIFGPDQLPKIASQAGKMIRDLRRMAEQAKADLSDGLGPEFADFDVADLNPRAFVRKHLLDDLDGTSPPVQSAPLPHPMDTGQRPPFDSEAT